MRGPPGSQPSKLEEQWFLSAGMGANYLGQLVQCTCSVCACRNPDVVGAYVLVNNLIILRDHFDISDVGNIGTPKFKVSCVLRAPSLLFEIPCRWG